MKLYAVSGRPVVVGETAIADFDLKRRMIMFTAQQLTELGDLNGMNAACLLGKEKVWSIPDALLARIRIRSAMSTLKTVADGFDRLEDETLLWD